MKKFLFFYFIIFSSQLTRSQNFIVGVKAGYCTYSLTELKSFQQECLESTPYLEKSVISFPNNYIYSSSIEIRINPANYIGISFSYYSTGARNHIKDYSGEYKLDMPLSGYRMGVTYKNIHLTNNRINVYGQTQLGLISSNLRLKESLVLNGISSFQNKYTFRSRVLFFEPSVGAIYNINSHLLLDLGLGYEFNLKGELENSRGKLRGDFGSKVHLDWSGFRLMLGFYVKF